MKKLPYSDVSPSTGMVGWNVRSNLEARRPYVLPSCPRNEPYVDVIVDGTPDEWYRSSRAYRKQTNETGTAGFTVFGVQHRPGGAETIGAGAIYTLPVCVCVYTYGTADTTSFPRSIA